MANVALSKEQLRNAAFDFYLKDGLVTDQELQEFVEEYFGYRIPMENVCPEHSSPMSFLADQFFERVRTSLGFANRGGGKTINVAILNVLDAVFKPGVDIASAGAIMQQADKGYEYLRKFLFEEALFLRMVVSSVKQKTVLNNGSIVQILAGTYHGLNSPHPNKFRCDEIELMLWVILQEGLQMSIEKQGYKAQDTLTSTRKFSKGTMQRMLDEAPKKNVKVYSWCVFEVLERCERKCQGDPKYGDCPVYSIKDKDGKEQLMCGGIAHQCNGWYKIDDFVKKGQILDWDTWQTQWRNLRPSSTILVYADFFRDEFPWIVEPFQIPEHWTIVSGIDFGSHYAYLKFAIDPTDDTWYLYWEYYTEVDRSLETHTTFMAESPWFTRREYCYGDPSGKQAIIDLNGHIRKLKTGGPMVEKANNDLYGGVNMVKSMLTRRGPQGLPKLRIFNWCERIRKEWSTLYRHKLDKDGIPQKDIIVKQDDHASDAARYAIYSFNTIRGYVRSGRARGLS